MWFKKKKGRDKSLPKSKDNLVLHKSEITDWERLKNVVSESVVNNIEVKNSIVQSNESDENNDLDDDSSSESTGNIDDEELHHYDEEDEDDEEASYSSSESSESSDSNHDGMDDNDFMHRLFTNDPKLTEIDISIESNDYETCNEFSKALSMNFHVQILHLTGNNSEVRHKIFKTITAAVAKNSSISTLEMKRASIDRQMAIELGISLGCCKSLQTLKLTNCDFKDSALAILFLGLQHCATLQEIIINCCDLSKSGLDYVAATLSFMKIKSLSLIDSNIASEEMKFLFKRIAKNSYLGELNLSRNSLDVNDAQSLALCLKSSEQNIQNLTLGSCSLDDECIQILSNSFMQSKRLQKISLPRNDFTGKGAMVLKRVLEKNSSIIELNVDGCRISSNKKLAIADALRCNNSFLKSFCSNEVSITILDAVDLLCGKEEKKT